MNLDKLDAAIAWIEANPQLHDQADPFAKRACGTTMCLAGVLCFLDGWVPDWEHGFNGELSYGVLKDAVARNAMECAREILGATDQQKNALFFAADNLAEIQALRDEYAAARAET